MPTIIITALTPSELFEHALTKARAASAEIERLRHAPLAPAETMHDRLLVVAMHAQALSEAFEIIDTLADDAARVEVGLNVSPSQSREEVSPSQGCAEEIDPNTN